VTEPGRRGRLKVFLGYAAGVGKTYQMLSEAGELKQRGVDVVIAYFEPHGRDDTIALTDGLETIPRQVMAYRGSRFEEMDTDAVLRRRPAVALVDEFAHTNVPGSTRAKRWEDVHVILDAGIDVHTTLNVQHVESLNDQIWQGAGVRVRETIPDWVVKQADQIVMVDLTPRALLNRLERGVVYPPDRARAALRNFFREPTLVALRELAMRQTAHVVESRHGGEDESSPGPVAPGAPAPARDRLLLVIEPLPASAALIRRGRRVADYLRADCLAVYVSRTADLHHLSAKQRDTLRRQLNFAQALQIETRILEGRNVPEAVVTFARRNGVSQIFLSREENRGLRSWFGAGRLERMVNLAHDMQVTIVADRSTRPGG
jgi:two-component system sensor histidine kinase KdpD